MLLDLSKTYFIYYLACCIFYIVTSILAIFKNHNIKIINNKIILLPWLFHFILIAHSSSTGLNLSLISSLSIILWVGLGLYLSENQYNDIPILKPAILLFSGIIIMASYYTYNNTLHNIAQLNSKSLVLIIHFISMNITYALLFWLCLHIFIAKTAYKYLHNPQNSTVKIKKYIKNLPPLLKMEQITMQRLNGLWLFMTLVILTGISLYFFNSSHIQLGYASHKIFFSLICWVAFSWFLWQKNTIGISNKNTVIYIGIIFALWIIAYIIANFI